MARYDGVSPSCVRCGDQAHKDWVNAQGVNFIELLLLQTMEPGNKAYKTLAEILEKEAKKVEKKT